MIFVPVSHLQQSYHNLETNLVYLVSALVSFFYIFILMPWRICSVPQLGRRVRLSTKELLLISFCRSRVLHGFANATQANSSRQKAAALLKGNIVNLKTAA